MNSLYVAIVATGISVAASGSGSKVVKSESPVELFTIRTILVSVANEKLVVNEVRNHWKKISLMALTICCPTGASSRGMKLVYPRI